MTSASPLSVTQFKIPLGSPKEQESFVQNMNLMWAMTNSAEIRNAGNLTLWPPDAKNWLIGKDPDAR